MQALKLKAAMKNPDEFYFAMHRKKTEGGVHVLDGAESLPHDVVQVGDTRWGILPPTVVQVLVRRMDCGQPGNETCRGAETKSGFALGSITAWWSSVRNWRRSEPLSSK